MDRLEVNTEDGLKLAADNVGTGRYLGDVQVVTKLVSDFLSACLSLLHDVQTGEKPHEEATEAMNDLAKQYAGVFLGESKEYIAQPWNSPERLGLYLRAMKPAHMADYDRPADAFFAMLGSVAIEAAVQAGNGSMTEQEAQHAIAHTRDDAIRALLGVR